VSAIDACKIKRNANDRAIARAPGSSLKKEGWIMTFVVCEPCYDCKYTDCVTVCPAECFFQDEKMLYIHPDPCIDCEACAPECPVEAIFRDSEVPSKWSSFTELNKDKATELQAGGQEPMSTDKQDALLGPECKQKA